MLNKCGGRKFVLAVGVLLVAAAALWADKLDAGAFVTLILGTAGAYVTGNVVQKATAKEGGRS